MSSSSASSARPNSAKLRQTELVHRLRAPPRDPLRCTNTNVAQCIAPLPPGGATVPPTTPLQSMRPRFVLRNQVKVKNSNEDDEGASDPVAASNDGYLRSFGGSSTTAVSPRANANDTSLRSLLAARRMARTTAGGGGAYANSSSGAAEAFGSFPFRPKQSQFLALNDQLHTATTPLQIVLDVGSMEKDAVATMEALAQRLRAYLDGLAMSLERLVERAEAAVAEEGASDAPTNVGQRLTRRLSSFCPMSIPSFAQRKADEVVDEMIGGPSSASAAAMKGGSDQHATVAQVLRELYALVPRRLPDIVFSYWDFTLSDSLESSLSAAFGGVGMAMTAAWDLLEQHRHHLPDDGGGAPAMSANNPDHVEPSDPAADAPRGQSPRHIRRRCDVVWRMHHCKLRSHSMVALPLHFPQEEEGALAEPSSTGVPLVASGWSGVDGGGGRRSTFARLRSSLNAYAAALPTSLQLSTLSLCHCIWRESAHSGVQSVLRSSGWSLRDVELRGAHVTPELVAGLSAVLQRPGGCLRRVVWANCTGWSTTDDAMQLALMEGVKRSHSLNDVTLQGVPLPPTAGIALLGAVAYNAKLAMVRLESCHFVTPKFLNTLHAAMQSKERGVQGQRGRRCRASVGTSSSLEATVRSNVSE